MKTYAMRVSVLMLGALATGAGAVRLKAGTPSSRGEVRAARAAAANAFVNALELFEPFAPDAAVDTHW